MKNSSTQFSCYCLLKGIISSCSTISKLSSETEEESSHLPQHHIHLFSLLFSGIYFNQWKTSQPHQFCITIETLFADS